VGLNPTKDNPVVLDQGSFFLSRSSVCIFMAFLITMTDLKVCG